jgi:hypothetical protein
MGTAIRDVLPLVRAAVATAQAGEDGGGPTA